MHLTKISLVIATSALLTACQTRPPPLSKEEAHAKLVATLNVYDDNRVGFKSLDTTSAIYWLWSSDKDRILGFEINGKLYNARDLVSLTSERTEKSYVYKITATFKNGEVETEFTGSGWNHKTQKDGIYGPSWASCDRNKQCNAWRSINDSDYNKDLRKILTAFNDSYLKKDISSFQLRREIMSDYRAIPYTGNFTRLVPLTDAQREQIQASLRAGIAKREADEAAYNAENRAKEAAAEAKILAEAQQMRKNVRIGTRTNCGSVFELRLPMVGVQTIVGMQFLALDQLYGPSANCKFINGRYVGR